MGERKEADRERMRIKVTERRKRVEKNVMEMFLSRVHCCCYETP